jgi:glycine/D-amino acid oxidase-like deaminating enzyme
MSYHLLRSLALGEHRRIAAHMPVPVLWNGSLEWRDAAHGAETLPEEVLRMRERGTEMHLLDVAGAAAIQPGLQVAPGTPLAWGAHDGALNGPATTRLLLEQAQSLGARLRMPVRVRDIASRSGGGVRITTDGDSIDADRVILAAGTGTTALAERAGFALPQKTKAGVIALTAPMPPVLRTVLYGPDVHMAMVAWCSARKTARPRGQRTPSGSPASPMPSPIPRSLPSMVSAFWRGRAVMCPRLPARASRRSGSAGGPCLRMGCRQSVLRRVPRRSTRR